MAMDTQERYTCKHLRTPLLATHDTIILGVSLLKTYDLDHLDRFVYRQTSAPRKSGKKNEKEKDRFVSTRKLAKLLKIVEINNV